MALNEKEYSEKEYRLILPKLDNSGNKIEVDKIKKYAIDMSTKFGGVTIRPTVLGCYKNGEGKLQCEENIEIVSDRDLDSVDFDKRQEQVESDIKFINDLAVRAGKEFGQESIIMLRDAIDDVSFVPGIKKEHLEKDMLGLDPFRKLI